MSLLILPEPDAAVLARRDEIIRQLSKLVAAPGLIVDREGCRTFETDALTAYRCIPLAVVLPASTEEVSRVLRFCHDTKIKVVPRGAGTSLCGGALPLEDAIVLGISRMSKVLAIDVTNRAARVEAGVTNIAISNAVAAEGFFYAPDPSSQLACTLVEIGGDHLDAAGYDFLGLIIGSEGQLGIVTEATVRLLKAPEGARPMLLGFSSSEAAGACVAAIIAAGIIPVALEFMDRPAIHVCENFAHAGYPLDVEALLIVEVEGSEDEIDNLLETIAEIAQDYAPLVIRISQSAAESARIWKGRKAAFGTFGQISDYYCMDGVIPLSRLPETLAAVNQICKRYRFDVANVFHAGDGNLHPLILYNANDPAELERAELCGAEILKLCVKLGGCLTGEHGVGIEKRELMRVQCTAADIAQ